MIILWHFNFIPVSEQQKIVTKFTGAFFYLNMSYQGVYIRSCEQQKLYKISRYTAVEKVFTMPIKEQNIWLVFKLNELLCPP